MKKCITILIILCCICTNIFADTFVEAYGVEPGLEPVITAKINPAVMAVADMGFTGKVPNFKQEVPSLSRVDIHKYQEATETFKSDVFYVYWNILGGDASIPKISLAINSALLPTSGTHSVDWKVSWNNGDNYVDSINNKMSQIYPPVVQPTADGASTVSNPPEEPKKNVLKRVSGYQALYAETLDPFWKASMRKYEAQLWIHISAN